MEIDAAVLRGADGAYSIEAVELEEPRTGEALVRIAGVGLCHTDMLARFPPLSATLPGVLGHEGAGVVEAVGPGTTRVAVGDNVVLSFDSCAWCDACLSGTPAQCVEFGVRNMSGRRIDGSTSVTDKGGSPISARWFGQGAFASHVLATERNLVRVEPDLPIELFGPLGCGVQTGAASILVGLSAFAGARIAIFGVGAVGLSAVMAAQVAGAAEVVAVDLHASRLTLAGELGATRIVDGADPDMAALVRADGAGMDIVLDTTGVSSVVSNALMSLKAGGRAGLVGVGGDLSIPLAAIVGRTMTFLVEGNAIPQVTIPRLVGLWRQGRFPFDRLIRTYPLAEINQAEADSLDGSTVKAVLVPAP